MDAKTIYAKSSDIKGRTYLEYRRDMKKKAIAELEIIEYLRDKLKEHYTNAKDINVEKWGGDKFLWFLRKGGITREPDFRAIIDDNEVFIEFQYSDRDDLKYYDFKVSKVAKKKKGERFPIDNKLFFYIHKVLKSYAFFTPQWIVENGKYDYVPAWRVSAYRVPKEKFHSILKEDNQLNEIIEIIDAKNGILYFQYELINIWKEELLEELQKVVDENKLINIMPKDLESFFRIIFILDNLEKIPKNANLWLIYILSFIDNNAKLEELAKIVYCIDYLYSKIELKDNEQKILKSKLIELLNIVKNYEKNDGTYSSDITKSPVEEMRYALFSINNIEDIIQDMIHYYNVDLKPIKKIYENVNNVKKIANMIKR